MGDMGDVFRAMTEYKKQKRQSNTESSTKILTDRGIEFKAFNNGVMLRVGEYDFFPSTGLFINRKTKKEGRGVFKLIKSIKGDPK